MFIISSFDKDTKVLILGDKKLSNVVDTYTDSDQYRSYKDYLDYGIKEDIENILIPELNKFVPTDISSFVSSSTYKDDDGNDIPIDSLVQVTKFNRNASNTINESFNEVKVNLVRENVPISESRGDIKHFAVYNTRLHGAFTLCLLPHMDRFGVIRKNDKIYTFINTLTLDDGLTFDGSKLKFVDQFNSILISGRTKPKVTMFKKNVSIIHLVIALAKLEYGVEDGVKYSKRFINSLRNPQIMSHIAGTESDHKALGSEAAEVLLQNYVHYVNDDEISNFDLDSKIEKGYLNTTITRDILNELCSFNNTIGKTISRDVITNDNKVIVKKEVKVDQTIVKILNENYIDTIYVYKELNVLSKYTSKIIQLPSIISKGTPIIQAMVDVIPQLKGLSESPKDYEVDCVGGIIIPSNTIITKELLACFDFLGITEVSVKDEIKNKKVVTYYAEEEFICNRHYPNTNSDTDGSWIYVDINNNIKEPSQMLTCHDISALTSLYLKFIEGEHLDLVADSDVGLRKKVNQSFDHMRKAVRYVILNTIRSRKSDVKLALFNENRKSYTNSMNKIFEYFGSNLWSYLQKTLKVVDTLDLSNPIATMSSLTKINTPVKDSNSVPDEVRRLTMGHYGRICPYETPQSGKLGVVNNTAVGCIIDKGTMYTEYYKITHTNSKSYIDMTPIRMSVIQEEKFRIADISSFTINYSDLSVTSNGVVPARIPDPNSLEKMTFANIDSKYVQFVSTRANQHQSHAGTTVPFPGADDAARLLFAAAMVKQVKGLVNGQIPLVGTTAYTNILNMNDIYRIFAEDDGVVNRIFDSSVSIKYDSGIIKTYSYDLITLTAGSVILRYVEVIVNQRVFKGQSLISSNYTKEGNIAIGCNALVAYITDGYNYEDGASISDRLSDNLTSYGVHSDTYNVPKSALYSDPTNLNFNNYLEENDRVVTFSNTVVNGKKKKFTNKEDLISKNIRGFIIRNKDLRNRDNKVSSYKVSSISFKKLTASDKICNRDGNKGIACRIYKNSEMPYLENGVFIDVKFNPNGIASRMNAGQILEASLGLVCFVLGIRCVSDSFQAATTKDVKLMLSYVVDLANSTNDEEVYVKYPTIPNELHQYCKDNIKSIRYWKGTFNKEGKAYLINPISGKRSLQKVVIGINYIYKLNQEGDLKLHARSGHITGRYTKIMDSPTQGSSVGGGQKMGYMETDALSGYGATNTLSELYNERGDNYIARSNMAVDVLHSGDKSYFVDGKLGIRRSVMYMLELLKSLGVDAKFTEDELLTGYNEDRILYKVPAITKAVINGVKPVDKDNELLVNLMDLLNKK